MDANPPRRSDTPCAVLAHLSDPHLPPPLPVHPRDLLNKRALSLISWHLRRRHHHLRAMTDAVMEDIARHAPDAVAITGDLTNFGLPAEYRAVAAWLETIAFPTHVIPGNHDAMAPQAFSDGPAFWQTWMTRRASDFPYVRRIGADIAPGIRPLALIGVDSAISSPIFMAYGRVGEEQAIRLERLLATLGREGIARIVMIHHPPRAGLVKWRKSLLDHDAIAGVLRGAGCELVLHGHSHDSTLSRIPGSDIPLLGIASASQSTSDPQRMAAWNHIAVTRRANAWSIDVTRRAIDPAGHAFDQRQHHFERPLVA